jgi:hypothetical protein
MRIAFLILPMVLLSAPAIPCSCNPDRTVETEYADAEVVFRGVVLSREDYRAPAPGDFFDTGFRVLFQVTEVWKGEVKDVFTVISGPGTCRYLHEPGMGYLVFAARWPKGGDEYWTNRCQGTREATESEAVTLLGEPRHRHSGATRHSPSSK